MAVVIDDGVSPFEFGTACEVFGIDRTDDVGIRFEFQVCSPRTEPLRAHSGFWMQADHGLSALETADLVGAGVRTRLRAARQLSAALHQVVERGAPW